MPERWILRGAKNGDDNSPGGKSTLRRRINEIASSLSISPALAQIVTNRGIGTVEEARRFLSPTLENLHSPFLFKDMEKAAKRILRAIMDQEKVLI